MTQKNKEVDDKGVSPLDNIIGEMLSVLRGVFQKYADKAGEKLGGKFQAGIVPFLRDKGDGSFKPDARIAIVPVKTVENESKGTDTAEVGGSKEATGGEESPEAPTIAG